MKNKIGYLTKLAFLFVLVASASLPAGAQSPSTPAPREEKLLNKLKLVVWSDATRNKVVVKIRIHSGAAFDPLGKEGLMQLLSDIIFPNESAREFFRDDLGGSLAVACNYDYIQVTATGDSDKFLTILETLSSAVTNPPINKELTERVRVPHLARLAEMEKDPAYLADVAVARRLLGNYPYGRPALGTSESVGRIDFADLLFAKQRFLASDNATVAITGNVKADFATRAVRRYFGSWLKADNKVPSTFAQPELPKPELQIIDSKSDGVSELRFAMRGVARNSSDFYATKIVEKILERRVRSREGARGFARLNANLLPGTFILGVSSWNVATVRKIDNMIALPEGLLGFPGSLLKSEVTVEEFDNAKRSVGDAFASADPVDSWLDAQTFRLTSLKDDQASFQATTRADAQRVVEGFLKQASASLLLVTATTTTVAAQ